MLQRVLALHAAIAAVALLVCTGCERIGNERWSRLELHRSDFNVDSAIAVAIKTHEAMAVWTERPTDTGIEVVADASILPDCTTWKTSVHKLGDRLRIDSRKETIEAGMCTGVFTRRWERLNLVLPRGFYHMTWTYESDTIVNRLVTARP